MFSDAIRRGAAVTLIPLLLAGCAGGGVERVSAPPPKYGDPADLVAWVSVAPVEFHSGETVQIEVGIRNPTPHPIMAAVYAPCMSFVVNDVNGTRVVPGGACLAMIVPAEIPPGEAITAQFSWDGTTHAGMPLPPGEYELGSAGLPVYATAVTIRILAP